MPTALNLSQTCLNGDAGNDIELAQSRHGLVKAQIISDLDEVAPDAGNTLDVYRLGDIYRRISVEQTSVTYLESLNLKQERNIV
jgi:hypothetical protein